MIAAVLIAASVLAPAGTTTMQGAPVCLPALAQPGHSYPLSVSVSGSGPLTLAIVPDTGGLHASLRQVPASWVTFAANPASPGSVAFTLSVPSDAAPGAYWSNIEAGTHGQPQSGAGVTVTNRTAATTGIVFTVGPSATPPPPCDALDLAQSTGKYPPWPSKAYATTSWKQVYARLKGGPVTPDGGPTAGTGTPARSSVAPAYSPAASTASASVGPNRDAWVVIAVLIVIGLAMLAKWRRS
jgi:hypothetical protein